MPIRPENKSRYPRDWKRISAAIRERAGNRCERCGAENGKPHPITGSRVVLTCMHLDHAPENVAESNLQAACQRCHLTYDAQHHAETARRTRRTRMQTGELLSGDIV